MGWWGVGMVGNKELTGMQLKSSGLSQEEAYKELQIISQELLLWEMTVAQFEATVSS